MSLRRLLVSFKFPLLICAINSPSLTIAQDKAADPYLLAKPVLEQNCIHCHGEAKAKGDLRLDTRVGLLAGGENDAAIDLDNLAESQILKLTHLSSGHDDIMPPAKHSDPLSAAEKAALKNWILAKAPYPHGAQLIPKKKMPPLAELVENLTQINAYPSQIQLDSNDDSHTILTYGTYKNATTRELTPAVKLALTDPTIAKLEQNTLTPLKNGSTTLTISIGDKSTTVPVIVKNAGLKLPTTFRQHVMPTLTAMGCNTGSCHGSARGQDGFQLSLFGFDPEGDHFRITQEMIGRRLNLANPENSLLLTKAAGLVPHTGGKLTDVGSANYKTLLKWIQDGANYDKDSDDKLPIGIEVYPKQLVVTDGGQTSQLTVRAVYADGSDRDVTHLSSFSTSNDASVLVAQKSGLMTTKSRGEAFIMARFHTFTEGMQSIVIPEKLEYTRPEVIANNYIDHLVSKKLHKLRIVPSGLSSDRVFIRRLYLDLIGSLPTVIELDTFLNDTSPDKRAKLIETLIERPEFTDIWVMKWSELLQIRTFQNQVSYKSALLYNDWLKQQFYEDRPFNEIVNDLLSAKGGNFSEPATNFYQVELDTKKLTENIAQVFMGTRIQCAQCHNHPFDRWTMDDYYSFASFFTQVKRKKSADPREYIIFDGGGEIKNPVTNQDAKPKFLGGEFPIIKGTNRRELMADWLTDPQNPWFASNISNIVWDHFFGKGIIHPVDDVRISNPPSNPELLDALAEKFKQQNFSIKELARDICNSRTYQLASTTNETNKSDERNFSHSLIRRIRAEVLLDSIAQVTKTPNKFKGLPSGAKATQIADGNTTNYFLTTFGRATRQTVCSCEVVLEPNLSQALHLINGDSIHQRIQQGKLIGKWIGEEKSNLEIINTIYLSALSRAPTIDEQNRLLDHFTKIDPKVPEQRIALLEDIFWAVLNTKEYIFNH